jgi:hypothetical protein
LASTNHHGKSVDKQHNVGNDELYGAAQGVDSELIDGDEAVVFKVLKIHQSHRRILFARELVEGYARAF